MTELYKFAQNTVFELYWCLLRLEGMNMNGKCIKWGIIMCQGQTGNILCFSPEEMYIFHI